MNTVKNGLLAPLQRRLLLADRNGPLATTAELADLVAGAVKTREPGQNPATRTFQALRIFINAELEELQQALRPACDVLQTGGRLVVISFHSLEDRIVKQFIAQHFRERSIDRRAPPCGAAPQAECLHAQGKPGGAASNPARSCHRRGGGQSMPRRAPCAWRSARRHDAAEPSVLLLAVLASALYLVRTQPRVAPACSPSWTRALRPRRADWKPSTSARRWKTPRPRRCGWKPLARAAADAHSHAGDHAVRGGPTPGCRAGRPAHGRPGHEPQCAVHLQPLLAARRRSGAASSSWAVIALGFVGWRRARPMSRWWATIFPAPGRVRFARTLELPPTGPHPGPQRPDPGVQRAGAASIWAIPEDVDARKPERKQQGSPLLLEMPQPS